MAGFLAALPLALTLGILFWLADFVHDLLGPKSTVGKLLGSIGLRFATGEVVAYLIGLVVALTTIYVLGLLVEAGMKNRWNVLLQTVLGRVPLVGTIYQASKQLIRMLERDEQADLKGMSPVMCQFGGDGGTAVLALMPNPKRIRLNGRDYHAVLVPTAPVPFGGAILYVPVEWVEPVDFAFEGLLNVYMSMGGTSPEYMQTTPGADKAADDRAAPSGDKRNGSDQES